MPTTLEVESKLIPWSCEPVELITVLFMLKHDLKPLIERTNSDWGKHRDLAIHPSAMAWVSYLALSKDIHGPTIQCPAPQRDQGSSELIKDSQCLLEEMSWRSSPPWLCPWCELLDSLYQQPIWGLSLPRLTNKKLRRLHLNSKITSLRCSQYLC